VGKSALGQGSIALAGGSGTALPLCHGLQFAGSDGSYWAVLLVSHCAELSKRRNCSAAQVEEETP
jgi:hypothetical protein